MATSTSIFRWDVDTSPFLQKIPGSCACNTTYDNELPSLQ